MMEKFNKPIIVPWGLTLSAEISFKHAVNLSKASGADIALVRLAKTESLIPEIKNDLDEVAEDLFKKYGIKPKVIVSQGDVFSRFTEIAKEQESNMIIKHMNPVKGIEKITGSKTMKIIAGSTVPYIVIQDVPKREKLKQIVLPLDHTVETKEKLLWLVYFSKFCQPFVHIFVPKTTDKRYLQYIKNNVAFAKKVLDGNSIEYDLTSSEDDNFGKAFLKFANEKDADLIIMMLPKDLGFGSLLFGSKEQEIIANEYKIPIMCINPRTDLKSVAWK